MVVREVEIEKADRTGCGQGVGRARRRVGIFGDRAGQRRCADHRPVQVGHEDAIDADRQLFDRHHGELGAGAEVEGEARCVRDFAARVGRQGGEVLDITAELVLHGARKVFGAREVDLQRVDARTAVVAVRCTCVFTQLVGQRVVARLGVQGVVARAAIEIVVPGTAMSTGARAVRAADAPTRTTGTTPRSP